MYLKDHPLTTKFKVTNCPWMKGRIMRSTQGGVTVKLSIPNTAPGDDVVGNYTAPICMSGQTEVTPL